MSRSLLARLLPALAVLASVAAPLQTRDGPAVMLLDAVTVRP